MISAKHQKEGRDVMSTNAWGMLYGTLVMGLLALSLGYDFVELSFQYLSSLLYLSVFGSVIGFGAYFILVGRIGASHAPMQHCCPAGGINSFPTFFEGYIPGALGTLSLVYV